MQIEAILGTSLPVFVSLTVCVLGLAAFLTGQAVAATWRPLWHLLAYCLLLGLTDRFLTWGLFQGQLLSISGFLVDTAVLTGIAFVGFRTKQVWKIVHQYPWLYERTSLWTYRDKPSPGEHEPRGNT